MIVIWIVWAMIGLCLIGIWSDHFVRRHRLRREYQEKIKSLAFKDPNWMR